MKLYPMASAGYVPGAHGGDAAGPAAGGAETARAGRPSWWICQAISSSRKQALVPDSVASAGLLRAAEVLFVVAHTGLSPSLCRLQSKWVQSCTPGSPGLGRIM